MRWRFWVRVLLPVLLMVYHSAESWGQAPGVAANAAAALGVAPGATFTRLTFATLDQWAYVKNPYFQLTGNTSFENGRGSAATTFDLASPATDSQHNSLTKLIHNLPPFGVEWGQGLDYFIPKAVSVGFDYFHFADHDTGVARHGAVPPIQTDTYLYNLALRFYFFDPGKPGINYFMGVGLGILDGTLRAAPIIGQSARFVAYSQNPFGTTRLGLETRGDNFGFRYELLLVNADRVHYAKNPYHQTLTTIDYSGAIVRVGLFYDFH